MHKLNPHDALRKKAEQALQKERNTKRKATLLAKRKNKKLRAAGKTWFKDVHTDLKEAYTREAPAVDNDSDEEDDE